jgi:hypothetical protein
MQRFTTEVIRRVYDDDDEGVFVEIGPDSDSLGLIELKPGNEESKNHYGDFKFVMTKDQAVAIAQAMVAMAEEMGETK